MNERSTQAVLRYLVPGDEKPIYYASVGGADAQLNIPNAEFEEKLVNINDARHQSVPASLDKEGFSLCSHTSAISDFYKLMDQQQEYEEELRDLVLPLVEGSHLLIFDHTLRSDSAAIRSEHNTREPASVVHNDYTEASAKKRMLTLLPSKEAEHLQTGRFAIINVWRSISGPVIQSPLTCCDASTLVDTDFVASERRAKDRVGELELVSFSPDHRWYYYPEMTMTEVLLIKTFDTAQDGRACRSAHTAFDNPLAPLDAPPRESMESRMLIFY
ncbi:MAG: CmcJ/NvfI family oxidoreductase [Pseudohongiellaceae bacterium]